MGDSDRRYKGDRRHRRNYDDDEYSRERRRDDRRPRSPREKRRKHKPRRRSSDEDDRSRRRGQRRYDEDSYGPPPPRHRDDRREDRRGDDGGRNKRRDDYRPGLEAKNPRARQPGLISTIIKKNEIWAANIEKMDKGYFKNLAKGQSPPIFYIGCADSRVVVEQMMGVGPGEVFVHRNVANLVQLVDNNVTSATEYAVKHLKVKHVVVCGHYGCGGIQAALSHKDFGGLNPWLKEIKDIYRAHKGELKNLSSDEQYKKMVEINVWEQCLNLYKISYVQEACSRGDLQIHGWVYDLETGRIVRLPINVQELKTEGQNYVFDE